VSVQQVAERSPMGGLRPVQAGDGRRRRVEDPVLVSQVPEPRRVRCRRLRVGGQSARERGGGGGMRRRRLRLRRLLMVVAGRDDVVP